MAASSEEIYSLLIQLEKERLVVPRSCVAEDFRYSVPAGGDADRWLCGSVVWNNLDIPIVSLERLCGMSPPAPGGRTRIVVFHPLSGGENSPYGVLAEGFPQMVRASREVLELDQAYTPPPDSPIICRVRMLHEQALIPDLEMIEQHLRTALAIN
jgi:chemosensory pili system protein ChpC